MHEQLVVLTPALVPFGAGLLAFFVYCGMCVIGRRPRSGDSRKHSKFFYFFIDYFVWLLRPFERLLLASRLTPDSLTLISLVACAGAGLAIATSHLATAGWLYIVAGGLDILDGRLARATNRSSKAGAFLDSVVDRWGEIFVFIGFAWFLRNTPWLLVDLIALSSSLMVSYTRARGESLGIVLDGGAMQRGERIALVSLGTLVTAWFHCAQETRYIAPHVIGVALLITAVGSTATAISKGWQGYRALHAREAVPSSRTRTAEHRAQ